jgi:hypothetical protein
LALIALKSITKRSIWEVGVVSVSREDVFGFEHVPRLDDYIYIAEFSER